MGISLTNNKTTKLTKMITQPFLSVPGTLPKPIHTRNKSECNKNRSRKTSAVSVASRITALTNASSNASARTALTSASSIQRNKSRKISTKPKIDQKSMTAKKSHKLERFSRESSRKSFGKRPDSDVSSRGDYYTTSDFAKMNYTFSGAMVCFKQIGPPARMDRFKKEATKRQQLT